LAQAEVSVGFELQASGSTTTTRSFSVSQTNNTANIHKYVWFDGTRRGTGTWKQMTCTPSREVLYGSGTWGSWEAQISGVLRCDMDSAILTQFGSLSPEYKAVLTC